MSQWVVDVVGNGHGQALQIDDVLYDAHSAFQHVQVASSPLFGRMLILDDAVQTTERDEYAYHEMLAHLPLLTHPHPRRVLIIGGGDGGTLEEVLKHPVERVTMVEIDGAVVEASRRYLPTIAGSAFEDPRTRLVIDDGIAFVRRTEERFDCLLIDSTDPKGPGLALFAEEFYRACRRVLTADGLLAAQSGSLLYQRDLAARVAQHLSATFPIVRPYWSAVPAYPGTLWSFTCASLRHDPQTAGGDAIASRIGGLHLRYYSAGAHHAALIVPAVL